MLIAFRKVGVFLHTKLNLTESVSDDLEFCVSAEKDQYNCSLSCTRMFALLHKRKAMIMVEKRKR